MNFKKTDGMFVRLVLMECIVALVALFFAHSYPNAASAIVDSLLLFTICFLIGIGIGALGNAIDEDSNRFDGLS